MRHLARLLLLIVVAGFAAATQAEDYVPDWSFNAGQHYIDTFAGSQERYYRGQRIVRLPDGDVVVAAQVPRRDSAGYALGLVRYSADGVRRNWVNPGSYGVSSNGYIIYDPLTAPLRHVVNVQDMQLWGDRLFVLLDVSFVAPGLLLGEPGQIYLAHAVDVVVFRTDGSFQSVTPVRQPGAAPATTGFRAGGIELFVPDPAALAPQLNLVYAGTGFNGTQGRAEFVRYRVSSASALTALTSVMTPNPAHRCGGSHGCEIRAIALGGRPAPRQPPRVYLGGWSNTAHDEEDFLVMRLAGDTGAVLPGFGSDLSGAATFNFPFSVAPEDTGRVLSVLTSRRSGNFNNDSIYLAGEITANCSYGAAVVKFRADGLPDVGFGSEGNGSVRWYPPDASPEQPICASPNSLVRLRGGMVIAEGRIAVASQRERGPVAPGPNEASYDGLLTVIDAVSGEIQANSLVPYTENGVRQRHSGFSDLVSEEHGRYLVTGTTRYRVYDSTLHEPQKGKWQVATVGLVPAYVDGAQP